MIFLLYFWADTKKKVAEFALEQLDKYIELLRNHPFDFDTARPFWRSQKGPSTVYERWVRREEFYQGNP